MKQATCNVLTLRVLFSLLTRSDVWLRDGPDCPRCMDMVANSDGLSRELKKALRVLMYLHAHSRGLSLSPHLDKSVDVNALSISLTPA